MLVEFAGLNRPVAFLDGTERLLARLAVIVHGWHWRQITGQTCEPLITVRYEKACFRIDAPWLDEPIHEVSELRAVGNLAVDLIEAYLFAHPSLLCLHCGAAEINGRLVVFPARSHAGKSTLMARLAAEGVPIYTDDVLPIQGAADEFGLSLGIAPRLRLPLPEHTSNRFRAVVDRYGILIDKDYAYLAPPVETRPAFGRSAPLGAIVLLDRRSSSETTLLPASKGDGLQELIRQNLAGSLAAPELVERAHHLIEGLPCFRLGYADLEEAVELIGHAFADWEQLPSGTAVASEDATVPAHEPVTIAASSGASYRRNPSVQLHHTDDELFLVLPQTDAIFRLNTIATGLWHLLQEPISIGEATEILQGAFPDREAARIAEDVNRLFSQLISNELVHTDVFTHPQPG